jgi:hypothetical protein
MHSSPHNTYGQQVIRRQSWLHIAAHGVAAHCTARHATPGESDTSASRSACTPAVVMNSLLFSHREGRHTLLCCHSCKERGGHASSEEALQRPPAFDMPAALCFTVNTPCFQIKGGKRLSRLAALELIKIGAHLRDVLGK